MDPQQAWQSALGQLQMEMPKASFDTWVRDTRPVSFEDGLLTIGVRNDYTREWLESRLTSTISRLMMGILNQTVSVRFTVIEFKEGQDGVEGDDEQQDQSLDENERLRELTRTAYAVQYDRIVNPYRRIIVDGYLARHVPEIGSRLAWLYIGCHQGAWMDGRREGAWIVHLPVPLISRYTGLSQSATKRLLYNPETWEALAGLLERPEQEKKWKTHRDGRLHRAPIGYAVHMTLPLTWADALAVKEWLTGHMKKGASLMNAMVEALEIKELVGEILLPIGAQASIEEARARLPNRPMYVVDIARDLQGTEGAGDLPEDIDKVADALQTRIIKAFGTIGITHYFVETVIPRAGLSPDLAMAITLLRSRCYVNEKTAEVRNETLVRGGYQEIATWLGIKRIKTVWEWVTGRVDQKTPEEKGASKENRKYIGRTCVKGIGPGPAFIVELPHKEDDQSSWKRFGIRLLEPLFDGGNDLISNGGNEPNKDGGNDPNKFVGNDPISNGGNDPDTWRKWDGINDFMTLILSLKTVQDSISSSTRAANGRKAQYFSWELLPLLVRNGAFAPNIRILLANEVKGEQFVAWLLYCFGKGQANSYDPMKTVMKTLLEGPNSWPGDAYDRLASMPPKVLIDLLDRAIKSDGQRTGNQDWDGQMTSLTTSSLMVLKKYLTG